jgi:hypothetical protein
VTTGMPRFTACSRRRSSSVRPRSRRQKLRPCQHVGARAPARLPREIIAEYLKNRPTAVAFSADGRLFLTNDTNGVLVAR